MIKEFEEWMRLKTKLSESTIMKYSRGVNNISEEMNKEKIIDKSLFSMQLFELDCAICSILNTETFIRKNTKGNRMYSCAIRYYRGYVTDTANIFLFDEESEDLVREKLRMIKTRVGQSEYRKGLLEKFDAKCAITGITQTNVLVASHIKPWAVSDKSEKVDIENGLLLSANMDKLFDGGMITFKRDGYIDISPCISQNDREILGLNNDIKIELKDTSSMSKYMEYHREVVFIK